MTVTRSTLLEIGRRQEVKVAGLDLGRGDAEINFDGVLVGFAKDPENVANTELLAVLDEIGVVIVESGKFEGAGLGSFPIPEFVDESIFVGLFAGENAAVGVLLPITGERLPGRFLVLIQLVGLLAAIG